MQLHDFDIDGFLQDYWQKKPLLIKNPWGGWENPLQPEELAGLACEEQVESRLILRVGDAWKLEHGPFPPARFGKLGNKQWTLLVQAVDHHVPEVAALIEPFRFIPNWRIDDVMVSCAADEGGVGPHFDQYDVFLIQGLGRRHWQVGAFCDTSTILLPHDDVRLLADFVATEEWILDPGDILYVPPRMAHNGVAIGDDCMTYSIGFRAPARSELIAHWCDHLLSVMQDDDRYTDQNLSAGQNPGEISTQALADLHAMMAQEMLNRDGFARWFGAYTSTPKYPDTDWRPDEPLEIEVLQEYIAAAIPLIRNPASRFSFIRQGENILLFVDGQTFPCSGTSAAFAEQICAQSSLLVTEAVAKSEAVMSLIAALHNKGALAFDQED